MTTRKISDSTVRRLSGYLRALRRLDRDGQAVVSSSELAAGSGTTAAQVRKDLSHFGSFGKRGHGYSVADLRSTLRRILGLERRWPVAVIGVGRIGSALLGYGRFADRGFDIVAAFDDDPDRIGRVLGGIETKALSELESEFARCGVAIAIIATPPEVAPELAHRAVKAGAAAILNFAPVKLDLPAEVAQRTMDVTLELEGLCYAMTSHEGSGGD